MTRPVSLLYIPPLSAKPASATTATEIAPKAATTPLSNKVIFVNDGSVEYAIEFASRVLLSETPCQ